MLNTIKIELKTSDLITAINGLKKREKEALLEDLLASTSPEYLKSIREARSNYKSGRTKKHDEVFGK
ncbi:MAG: hypothetical protein NT009_07700 [Proteobacteria bacterium]|nr:hypothetical protein [Pseudomonadota bacterium]